MTLWPLDPLGGQTWEAQKRQLEQGRRVSSALGGPEVTVVTRIVRNKDTAKGHCLVWGPQRTRASLGGGAFLRDTEALSVKTCPGVQRGSLWVSEAARTEATVGDQVVFLNIVGMGKRAALQLLPAPTSQKAKGQKDELGGDCSSEARADGVRG